MAEPGLEEGVVSDAIRIQFTHVEITRRAFEVTLDVLQHAHLITRRHRYEDVVAPPPDTG
jgi:hypothetical protein